MLRILAGSTTEGETRVTWRRCVITSLAACVISALLAFWRPVVILPPNFRLAAILYSALAWSGVVILAIFARRRPVGKGWLILGIVVNVVFSIAATVAIVSMFLFGSLECSPVPTETIFERYSCEMYMLFNRYRTTLYGVPYFPLLLQTEISAPVSVLGI